MRGRCGVKPFCPCVSFKLDHVSCWLLTCPCIVPYFILIDYLSQLSHSTMKGAVFHGQGDLRIQDVPEPQCGEGQVKVRPVWCGICGTGKFCFVACLYSTVNSKRPVALLVTELLKQEKAICLDQLKHKAGFSSSCWLTGTTTRSTRVSRRAKPLSNNTASHHQRKGASHIWP